jgi:hypothetical protein
MVSYDERQSRRQLIDTEPPSILSRSEELSTHSEPDIFVRSGELPSSAPRLVPSSSRDSLLSSTGSTSTASSCASSSAKFEFIVLKRKKIAPVDSNLVKACKCGVVFGWYIRKHHCRACGEVLCFECTSNRMKIPKLLVCYLNTEGWWSETEVCRICKPCSIKVVKYEASLVSIQKLYKEPPLLHLINFTTLCNKKTQTIFFQSTRYLEGKPGSYDQGALSYYLSEMRLIQYLFPSDTLTEEQTLFLKTNRHSLYNHSYWLMQLLKVDDYIGEISATDIASGMQTLCTRGCQPTLKLSDAVTIIMFSDTYGRAQPLAHTILDNHSPEEIEYYLPIILSSQNPKVHTIITGKITSTEDKANAKILACSVYWYLNSITTSLADICKQRFLGYISADIVNFRYFINAAASDTNATTLSTVVRDHIVCDPFDPTSKIIGIANTWVGGSYSKPLFIDYISCGLGMASPVKSTMMYKKEDVRKDACVLRLVKVAAKMCRSEDVVTYNVLPIDTSSGIIQIVKGCETLTKIYQAGSISNYLYKHNMNQIIRDVQTSYQNSLAFWTIITYILGIGDRHFDNIMIDTSGRLFHIDFDFIFGKDSKPYSPKIRLNSYMIEGIGGNDKYGEFKDKCRDIFMDIRQNIDVIYVLLLNLVVAEPSLGITEPFIKEHLVRAFFIGEPDTTVKDRLEFMIDTCKDSLVGTINDYIHTTAKSTSGLLSYLS